VCCMSLPPARRNGWPGPRIRLSLPSFSGGTPECPQLLQYTCQLVTNVRAVAPALVQVPPPKHLSPICIPELQSASVAKSIWLGQVEDVLSFLSCRLRVARAC
jgi:hypothetical protein